MTKPPTPYRATTPARHRGLLQLVRAARASLRQVGVKGTVARVRDAIGRDEEHARFGRWIRRHTPSAADLARMRAHSDALPYRPTLSIIVPVFAPAHLDACIASVVRQSYPR